MVATAAHLTDHVLPRPPVRQWAVAVPRACATSCNAIPLAALRLLLRAAEPRLRAHGPKLRPSVILDSDHDTEDPVTQVIGFPIPQCGTHPDVQMLRATLLITLRDGPLFDAHN